MRKRLKSFKKIAVAAAATAAVAGAIALRAVLMGSQGLPEGSREDIDFAELEDGIQYKASEDGYSAYAREQADLPLIEQPLTLVPEEGAALLPEGASATFAFAGTPARAALSFRYKIVSDGSGNAEVSIQFDGERPFAEASGIKLWREFLTEGAPQTDSRGNQLAIEPVASEAWSDCTAYDSSGYHTEPLLFRLSGGQHTVTITAEKNTILLESLTFYAPKTGIETESGAAGVGKPLVIEAELPYSRNDLSIAEVCDRLSAATSPCFQGVQVWNSLGGAGWSEIGQCVTWRVKVEKAGYYSVAFRYLQNFNSGAAVFRSFTIDGNSPFNGADTLRFPYGGGWQTLQPTDEAGEPLVFYLSEGVHEFQMTVTMGEMAQAVGLAQKSLYELNAVYRDILMLTGSTPDAYRDYQIAANLPETVRIIGREAELVEKLSDWMVFTNGEQGSESASLDNLARLLKGFAENPENIPANMSAFQNELTSFSTWLQSRLSQPLTLDKLELIPQGMAYTPPKVSFFQELARSTSLFFQSFAADYGMVGEFPQAEDAVEVWLTLGRDQYQIIKSLIDNDFSAKRGIAVDVKLVSASVLQAIAAGIAPDVFLFCNEADPVNLAVRDSLTDLTQFPNYETVAQRFSAQALVPYTFDGGVYALPLSQTFDMLFVRNDILSGLGLEVPQTWEDVFAMLSVLQQNKMEFAYPIPAQTSLSSFALMLFREQQDFYKEGGREVAFDTEEAVRAFEDWVKLYSEQQLLMSYNFVNRFKTGDMPIGIAALDTYNTLEVFAPEIRGLWSMHPLPGVRLEDGTIQRFGVSTTTGAFITRQSGDPQAAWEFLEWFTQSGTQSEYAAAIENRQGIAGRFNTANLEAFATIGWSVQARNQLNFQRQWALSIEQAPGGYFLGRHVDNIFREIVNEGSDVRETVRKYTQTINNELTRKRMEFGLEVSEGE